MTHHQDVLEINKAPLYEFEYLLTAEEEADPPKTILLEETTTIRQLLRTIVDTRVTETKRNDGDYTKFRSTYHSL